MDARLEEAVGELHAILDAGQREILADKIERRGLPLLSGGRGKRHHGERGEDHGAKLAGRVCETVACSEAQAAQIAALVQDLPEPGQVPEADRAALARAFRGESLSDDAVTAYLDAAAKARAADRAVLEGKVVELHGLLTASQRAALAERVAEDGPRALGMPGKGRGHGKKHGGKQHGGKQHGGKKGRGPGPQGEAQQFG
jgi:hypothetical protein